MSARVAKVVFVEGSVAVEEVAAQPDFEVVLGVALLTVDPPLGPHHLHFLQTVPAQQHQRVLLSIQPPQLHPVLLPEVFHQGPVDTLLQQRVPPLASDLVEGFQQQLFDIELAEVSHDLTSVPEDFLLEESVF